MFHPRRDRLRRQHPFGLRGKTRESNVIRRHPGKELLQDVTLATHGDANLRARCRQFARDPLPAYHRRSLEDDRIEAVLFEEAGRDKAGRAAADNGDGSFRHMGRIERSIHGASPPHGRPELYASLDRGFPK